MTSPYFTSTTLRMLAVLTWLSVTLTGCEDVMKEVTKKMPAGTDRYLQTAMPLGDAVLNRPKFTEADEERMAQENAQKFEQKSKIGDDILLDTYLNDIVQRIVAVAHPRPFTYSIRVVQDSSIKAHEALDEARE